MKRFLFGVVIGASLCAAVYFFTKPEESGNATEAPTVFKLGEIHGVGNLILSKQSYQESCSQTDDLPDLRFGKATFEWTQEFGFGVDLEGDQKAILRNNGNGNYTLVLPPLEQLYPIEQGFSQIDFHKATSQRAFEAWADPKFGIFGTLESFSNSKKRLDAALAVFVQDGKQQLSKENLVRAIQTPTSFELARMMPIVRKIADDRTELVARYVLTTDGKLNDYSAELEPNKALSEIASKKAHEIFEPLIRDVISNQRTTHEENGVELDGRPVDEFKDLKVEFRPYNGIAVSSYDHAAKCAP